MNSSFAELLEKLKILKEDFCASSLKLELETEIISTSEIDLANELSQEAGLDLTLKTSGASAVSDIFLARATGAHAILVPMVESGYALEKFFNNIENIYGENPSVKLLFNLETITALKNMDDILASSCIKNFDAIVFGRNDFCASLGKNSEFCGSEQVYSFVQDVLQKIKDTILELYIGGNVSKESESFLKQIENDKFTHFETRKIVFDKKILKSSKDYAKALDTALRFELLWLESKPFVNPLDISRKAILEHRIKG